MSWLCFLQDSSVHIYTISGDSLSEKTTFQVQKEVVSLAYSPNGTSLALTSGRSVLLYDTSNYQVCMCVCGGGGVPT